MADKKPLCLYEGDLKELQAGDTLSPVSDHEAAADPHLGYALESALGTAAASNVEDFEPAGAVSTHEAALDPHPVYALESALGTAAAQNVEAFEASGTVSSHEAAADPHPSYALESSLGTAATQDATAFEPANAVSTHNALTGTSVHGLGTASTANVTTSATDTTAGRVLKVGDYQGLLSENYQDSPLASLLTAADPSDIAYSGCTLFGSLSGTGKWYGGVLAPNGKIYVIPSNSTQVLEIDGVSNGKHWWALSKYTNKF